MNSSLFHFSIFMNKASNLPFNQWRQTQQQQQQKRDRLVWGGSLIGSSVFLIGIAWIAFHMSHTKIISLPADTPPAITLDLSTDIVPPSPPLMSTQPEPQPLEEQTAPLNAPLAPSPDIILPKTQKFEKIKPAEHKKIIQNQAITPVHRMTNKPTLASQSQSSSNTISANAEATHASSHIKASMSPATWQGNVLEKLERLKRYPSEAQSDKQEGVATIRITINRHGNVLSSKLGKSSGYSSLDKEAVALAYRANPLPAVPETIKGNNITLNVPVEFHLN